MKVPARRALLVILIGPSGVGKSSVKRYLKQRLNADSAPKYTTRARRRADEDKADFIFVQKNQFPTSGVLSFQSYGEWFGIQLDAIETSLSAHRSHILIVGDRPTADFLIGRYPDVAICILIYCEKDVLRERLRVPSSDSRVQRWPRVLEEVDRIYSLLGCVHFVVNNSGAWDSTRQQLEQLLGWLGFG
jgi:guanylate kinase